MGQVKRQSAPFDIIARRQVQIQKENCGSRVDTTHVSEHVSEDYSEDLSPPAPLVGRVQYFDKASSVGENGASILVGVVPEPATRAAGLGALALGAAGLRLWRKQNKTA